MNVTIIVVRRVNIDRSIPFRAAQTEEEEEEEEEKPSTPRHTRLQRQQQAALSQD